jgi:hypothetical protein
MSGYPKPHLEPVISQVCTFIGEGSIEHDDLLDTATQALRFYKDRYFPSFTVPVDPEEIARLKTRQRANKMRGNPYAQ